MSSYMKAVRNMWVHVSMTVRMRRMSGQGRLQRQPLRHISSPASPLSPSSSSCTTVRTIHTQRMSQSMMMGRPNPHPPSFPITASPPRPPRREQRLRLPKALRVVSRDIIGRMQRMRRAGRPRIRRGQILVPCQLGLFVQFLQDTGNPFHYALQWPGDGDDPLPGHHPSSFILCGELDPCARFFVEGFDSRTSPANDEPAGSLGDEEFDGSGAGAAVGGSRR